MPPGDAFTGFTKTGAAVSNPALLNVTGDFAYGWYFYNKLSNPDGDIYIPDCGMTDGLTGGYPNGNTAYYWTTNSNGPADAIMLYIYLNSVIPLRSIYRSNACSVRPVAE